MTDTGVHNDRYRGTMTYIGVHLQIQGVHLQIQGVHLQIQGVLYRHSGTLQTQGYNDIYRG